MEPDSPLRASSIGPPEFLTKGRSFDFAYRLQTPVWLFDIDAARIVFANEAACALWRAEDEAALQDRDLGADMSPAVRERLRQYQTDFWNGTSFNETWTLYPDGKPVSVQAVFHGFLLPDGRMGMLCEAPRGIDDNEPDNIRSAEALLHTDVMITLYHRSGPALYMNPAARTAAVTGDQVLADLFVDVRDHDTLMFELDRKGRHTLISKMYTSEGLRWHNLTAKLCIDSVTGTPAILATARDVTELKNARDRARYLADRDQLTGCFNRAYLQQLLSEMARFQPQRCALLFFDIDRFKQINDRFGHETGDTVLKVVAERAQTTVSRYDTVVRLGGDEFVILYTGVTDDADVLDNAEKLRDVLRAPIEVDAKRLTPTCSLGLTYFYPDGKNYTTVLGEADIALYASKSAGRDHLTVFNEALGHAAKERDRIEVELKAALERDEFVLHFQPRMELSTGRIQSVEALVRWQHPTRGLVQPGEFIDICEETGMIRHLGQAVLLKGLRLLETWHRDGVQHDISINISPSQFEDPALMETLRAFAETPGFPTNRVELEITENVLIDDHGSLARMLRQISSLGYRIAIDDFGVGYSNLSYISDFPVDCIKIDKSFISRLPETGPVVLLILSLARQLGAHTVAEGIETAEQADWLKEQNCEQAQGFLFHRPMPLEDLQHLIDEDLPIP